MNTTDSKWHDTPPDSPGFWWLYGEEEYGTMGGHYTGVFPPETKLHIVDVWKTGSGLMGVARGRMIELVPFDREKRQPGYIGVWQKAETPPPP